MSSTGLASARDHVRQAGSLVESDRLRFDFSHFEAVSHDQLQAIEKLSNEKLLVNDQVKTYEIPFSEKPEGVIAFFGDKYGDLVRVVDIGAGVRNFVEVHILDRRERLVRSG